EGNKSDFLRIIQRKPDNRADLVVIDIIDQCRDQNDFYASSVDVVDRPQLYVKQVADMPMAVGIIPDTVELQISEPQPGFGGSTSEVNVLGKLDSVGCGLNTVVPDL